MQKQGPVSMHCHKSTWRFVANHRVRGWTQTDRAGTERMRPKRLGAGSVFTWQMIAGFCLSILLAAFPHVANVFASELPAGYEANIQPLLTTYCTGCHGQDAPEAGMRLEYGVSEVDMTAQHEIWRAVAEKITTGEMPPESEPQLSNDERHTLTTWLQAALATVDCRKISQPGRVTIRRLNRTEYNMTVRDLVGVDFRPADDFPADDVGNGFDNIAEVLSLPPILMEKYLDAAERIIDQAFAAPATTQDLIRHFPSDTLSADDAATRVLKRFASRAFRRPVRPDELDGLWQLYTSQRDAGVGYPERLKLPMTAVLCSPKFLFRLELDEDDAPPVRNLNDFELGTRLSYFLWSSMPDDTLFELAADRRLGEAEVLREQVSRMLSDPKSSAFVENFIGQWLQLRSLNKIQPDPERFPQFSEELRTAMQQETLRFSEAIIRENRSVLEFLDADYTFVNEDLARLYGIEGVVGSELQRVSLTDPRRGGILTQASILTLTSNPTRTSPVKRGKWILENMLGAPPPPPPPGVQELQEEGETELLGSLRERMEQHRSDPSCAICHTKMDALGFGFENFDAVGAWRDLDGRFEIDASGSLPGNQSFRGPAELRKILRDQRRDQFVRCLAEKMLTYALGRELQPYDRCAIDQVIESVSKDDYRFQAMVLAVVQSEPFQKRGFRENTGGDNQ